MRLVVAGDDANEEVIAEEIEITGSGERFAVHRSIGTHARGLWSVSHIDTGFAVDHGNSIDDAIAAARDTWTKATPAQREAALTYARGIRISRLEQFATHPIDRGVQ